MLRAGASAKAAVGEYFVESVTRTTFKYVNGVAMKSSGQFNLCVSAHENSCEHLVENEFRSSTCSRDGRLLRIRIRVAFLAIASLLIVLAWISPLRAQTAGDFTVVVLPDTQNYSQYHPQIFDSQTQWVTNNAAAQSIQLVIGVGDIVNVGTEPHAVGQRKPFDRNSGPGRYS